jgi:hypothetical protein
MNAGLFQYLEIIMESSSPENAVLVGRDLVLESRFSFLLLFSLITLLTLKSNSRNYCARHFFGLVGSVIPGDEGVVHHCPSCQTQQS